MGHRNFTDVSKLPEYAEGVGLSLIRNVMIALHAPLACKINRADYRLILLVQEHLIHCSLSTLTYMYRWNKSHWENSRSGNIGFRKTGDEKFVQDSIKPARKLGEPCKSSNCMKSKVMNCEKFTETVRLNIFKEYWGILKADGS